MAGTFNQSLQCTQDVFIGFQAPSPPVQSNRQVIRHRRTCRRLLSVLAIAIAGLVVDIQPYCPKMPSTPLTCDYDARNIRTDSGLLNPSRHTQLLAPGLPTFNLIAVWPRTMFCGPLPPFLAAIRLIHIDFASMDIHQTHDLFSLLSHLPCPISSSQRPIAEWFLGTSYIKLPMGFNGLEA